MATEKELQSEIESLKTFQSITTAYTEIAAIRMRKVRDSVLKNRNFLTELDDVFKDVRTSYAREVLRLGTRKERASEKVTFLAHNGKTVAVFVSANTGLYGDIIERTFRLFIKEVLEDDLEVTIAGKLGLSIYQSRYPDRPYTFFELSDQEFNAEQLALLIKHVVQYEEIRVYYPTFHSAVNQQPTKYVISAETPLSEIKAREGQKEYYFFEPSLKEILVFFETEIFSSLMDQTVRESQLAKYAARIMALDRAGENMKEELKKLNLSRLKIKHSVENRKQIHSLASIKMW